MVWYGMVWYGMVWYGMVWYGMVWYGMVWYGMVRYGIDFLKVRFGIRTFPACFARFLPTYIVVGGWPWCDWGCVIILANEKRIFK